MITVIILVIIALVAVCCKYQKYRQDYLFNLKEDESVEIQSVLDQANNTLSEHQGGLSDDKIEKFDVTKSTVIEDFKGEIVQDIPLYRTMKSKEKASAQGRDELGVNEEDAKTEKSILNISPLKNRLKCYEKLFSSCETIDDILEVYIKNVGRDKLFNVVEIECLRYSLQFNNKVWSEKKQLHRSDLEDLVRQMLHKTGVVTTSKSAVETVNSDEVFEEYTINTNDNLPQSDGEYIDYKKRKDSPYKVFCEMRAIAPKSGIYFNHGMFIKNAQFMVDFTDNYESFTPFQSYYPTYSDMDDAQLRTYFTWRTNVRKGIVNETSLSYVFVYIYEIINNIGIKNPNDGFDKLVFIWIEYSKYASNINGYMRNWVKDYYICNHIDKTFKELVIRYGLEEFYEDVLVSAKDFGMTYDTTALYADYKFQDSKFYTKENEILVSKCYDTVIKNITPLFEVYGLDINGLFCRIEKYSTWWQPFSGAIYEKQSYIETTTEISPSEEYTYSSRGWQKYVSNKGDYKTVAMLSGYIIKRIEANLRIFFGHKYKLEPNKQAIIDRFQYKFDSSRYISVMMSDCEIDDIIDTTSKALFDGVDADISVVLNEKYSVEPYVSIKQMRTKQEMIKEHDHCRKFYLQAKILENLTDDFESDILLNTYIPTYENMTNKQLRCYFTWRTMIRSGTVITTHNSYIKLYICELINKIGVTDRYNAVSNLINVLNNFGKDNRSILNLVLNSVKAYYVYSDFNEPFYEFVQKFGIIEYYPNIAIEYGDVTDIDLFRHISSYKIIKSKFYSEKTAPIIAECFQSVMVAVIKYFKSNGIVFRTIGTEPGYETKYHNLFGRMIYYNHGSKGKRTVMLSSNEVYILEDNQIIDCVHPNNNEIMPTLMAFVIKRIEYNMRLITKFKYKLKTEPSMIPSKNDELAYIKIKSVVENIKFAEVIDNSVRTYFDIRYPNYKTNPERIFVKPKEFKFDESKLSKIRDEAEGTRKKLTIDEYDDFKADIPISEDYSKSAVSDIKEPDMTENICEHELIKSMSSVQKNAVMAILDCDLDKLSQISRSGNIMLEPLIEQINEISTLSDEISDIIIESDDGSYHICEDYYEDIKTIFGREIK